MYRLSRTNRILLGTLATTLLLFIALELRFHYYFLQDDGLEYYLPIYFHNWRSLLSGQLPLYDFHSFAGVPHASMGQPAVFYFPVYLAMLVSQSVWHHPFAAIDVLGIMNGLLAVAGAFLLLKELGTSDEAAAFGGLTALSGFFLWCGRMWTPTTMLCAWFPWMLLCSMRFIAKPQWDRALWLLLVRMGLLYAGHSQYFVLAVLFEHAFALTWLSIERPERWRSRAVKFLALDMPAVCLGLPFLLPLAVEVRRSLLRSSPVPYEMFATLHSSAVEWIFGQLLVFVKLHNIHDIFARSLPFMSYVGYIPTLLLFGTLFLLQERPRFRSFTIAGLIWFIIALLWSWNVGGHLIYHVPVFNRFRYPFKMLYFAGFFECLLAALVFNQLRRRIQIPLLAVMVLNWAWVFLILPDHAWRVQQYRVPLSSPWQAPLADGRYLVISDDPVFPPGESYSDQHIELNYSLLWGLDNLLGYEPMASRLDSAIALGNSHTGAYSGPVSELPMEHLKRWSVKYILASPTRGTFAQKLASAGFQVRTNRNGWTLWEDPSVLPRIRWEGLPAGQTQNRDIRWTEHVDSIEANLSGWPAARLEFAFAANPGLHVCVDKRCKAVAASSDGLIRVDIPPGTRLVRLYYSNALYFPSICVALATLVIMSIPVLRMGSFQKQDVETEPDCVTA